MKKLSLVIAIASFLTATNSFAVDQTENTILYDTKIFTKSLELSVKKDSEIIIDPPEKEVIRLDAEKLEDLAMNGDDIGIGEMLIETTANTCYATVKTNNDFKLQGDTIKPDGTRNTLASYSLVYSMQDNIVGDIDIDINIGMIDAHFSSNNDGEMPVGCNTAALKMKVFEYNLKAPVDVYNDIITIEVRAES